MKSFTATLTLLLFIVFNCNANCVQDDYIALKALYLSTNGDAWTSQTDGAAEWPSAADFGSAMNVAGLPAQYQDLELWHGIHLNSSGCVDEIRLQQNNLIGPLPIELGDVTNLIDLWLWKNQLNDTIPKELGNLTNLTDLGLYDNNLIGNIPPELGNMTSLDFLWLWDNQLSGSIPPELGDLANLEQIRLDNNNLSDTIPMELGSLTNLKDFRATSNNLTGKIPPELGDLTNLVILSLADNMLSDTIPAELGNLTDLEFLYLHTNNLSGVIPPQLSDMSSLTLLAAYTNQLSGTIPPELGQLSNLKTLLLSTNQLTGIIPPELGDMPSLTGLRLYSNQLEGCFHPNLSNLCTQLLSTYNSNNAISNGNNLDAPWEDFCDLGTSACTQSQVEYIALNRLYTGTGGDNWTSQTDGNAEWPSEAEFLANPTSLPPGFEDMEFWYGVGLNEDGNIDDLDMPNNNLTGNIPSAIGDLNDLIYLELCDNHLTGTIPINLENLSNLQIVELCNNQLIGDIPTEFESLNNLTKLLLSNNQFTGTIPNELGNLTNLEYLILTSNQLTGSIPTELSNLSNLKLLNIGSNQLTGSIPIELGNLTMLDYLNLENNLLSGPIPTEFGNLSEIILLSLNDNELSGQIPPSFGNLANLELLYLQNNGLSGCFDENLKNISDNLAEANIDDGNNFPTPWPTFLATSAGSCALSNSSACLHNDYLVLRELFLETSGIVWTNKAGWPTLPEFDMYDQVPPPGYEDLSMWEGVVVNADGCVTELDLNDNNLTGLIPVELGNMLELTLLDLGNNSLYGTIPEELGNLSNLSFLGLAENNLIGCYEPNLTNLCNYLTTIDNSAVSDGNNLDAAWEDFCASQAGLCNEMPDLIVAGFITYDVLCPGESTDVTFSIENIGDLDASSSTAAVYHTSINNANQIGSVNIASINAGESWTGIVNVSIPLSLMGQVNLFFVADDGGTVFESLEDNNEVNIEPNIDCSAQTIPDDKKIDWSNAGLLTDFCHPETIIHIPTTSSVVTFADSFVEDAINNAPADGAVIMFPPGLFYFKKQIKLKSKIVLKGSGAGETFLIGDLDRKINGMDVSESDLHFIRAQGGPSPDTTALTSEAPIFQNFIEVADATSFNAGDYVLVDFDDDHLLEGGSTPPYGNVGQIVLLESVDKVNNILHFSSQLRRTYTLAENTRAVRLNMVEKVGVECLTIIRADKIGPKPNIANIRFRYVADSWINAIASLKCNFAHIQIAASIYCQVSSSYMNDAHDHGKGGRAYGVSIELASSEVKVENNIFSKLRHSMLVQHGANGNVFAYNYSTEAKKSGWPVKKYTSDLLCHGNHPYFNLFESNIHHYGLIDKEKADNGQFNTYFRNRATFRWGFRITNDDAPAQNIVGYEIMNNSTVGAFDNFKTRIGTDFLRANRVEDGGNTPRIVEENTVNLPDISYYFNTATKPEFLANKGLPIIGFPNNFGEGTIPAFDRYNAGMLINDEKEALGVFAGGCLPYCPETLILDKDDFPNDLPAGDYFAKKFIESDATIANGADVKFSAGMEIDLLPEFDSKMANMFEAVIEGCPEP